MKKKVILFISMLAMTLLLAGCISIPIGDNTLELSTSGIEFVSNDEEVFEETEDIEEEPVVEEVEEEEEVADLVDEEEDEAEEAEAKSNGKCDDDYSDVYEVMPEGLPIPDCAVFTSMNFKTGSYDVYYETDMDWEDLLDIYKEFAEQIGTENPTQGKKPLEKEWTIEVKINDDKFFAHAWGLDEGGSEVRLIHWPIEE